MKENSIENLQNKKYFNNIDEAIKVYEEFRRFKNDGFIESIDTDFLFNLTDIILSDYKRVLKENEELKNDYENLNNSVVVKNYYIKNSIPIQKIKDKREEINKKILNAPKYDEKISVYRYQKQILQELIKEREEKENGKNV